MNATPWFLDKTNPLSSQPLGLFLALRHKAAPILKLIRHDLFGLGHIVSDADDFYSDSLGRVARIAFATPYRNQHIEGSFSKVFISAAPAQDEAVPRREPRTVDALATELATLAEEVS